MTKKKRIILIGVAVTLALVMTLGGLAAALNNDHEHEDTGAHKLIGVGLMGGLEEHHYGDDSWDQWAVWDTQFIVTNPNCEDWLYIEWVALIDSDGAFGETVIFEGPPDGPFPYELSPHQTFAVSIAELIAWWDDNGDPDDYIAEDPLDAYTLEITWSGAYYSRWWGWGKIRPLTGWQKEKCWYQFFGPDWADNGMAISEAEMKLYPSRMRFEFPSWWDLY